MLNQPVDHFVHRHAIGFGAVTDEDAMPKRRVDECDNVIGGGVGMAAEQCPCFGAHDQVLGRSEAGAPAHPVANKSRRLRLAGPTRVFPALAEPAAR